MSGQFRPISAVSPARLLSSKLGAVIEIGSCPKGIKCYKKKIHIENCTNTKVISPCIHFDISFAYLFRPNFTQNSFTVCTVVIIHIVCNEIKQKLHKNVVL